jgi:hypothetical protein
LVSNQPIQIHGNFTEIDDTQLSNIIGALASGYACTNLLQEYNVIFCTYIGGLCEGYYEEYFTRYGCEAAESGSCTASRMIRYRESPCIQDPDWPPGCTITWEWTFYYMRACA